MSLSDPEPEPRPANPPVPPAYWLGVCRGLEAAQAFLMSDGSNLDQLFDDFPILALPEFPDALAALPAAVERLDLSEICQENSRFLRSLMDDIRARAPQLLAALLGQCAEQLADEFRGTPRFNAARAIDLLVSSRNLLPPDDPGSVRALGAEGNARQRLADLGVEPRPNLERAVQRYEAARAGFDPAGPDFASCLMNEGTARQSLAELGVESRQNLERAVQRYEAARAGFDPVGPDFARCLMNEGNARQRLADLGVEPRPNLERAVQGYDSARAGFDPAGPDFARCLANEGNARHSLAKLGVEPRPNLERAVQRYEAARAGFDPAGPDFASCLMNEGTARQSLAELGVESRQNLERAVQGYDSARAGFDPAGPDFARCLMNEGNARQRLADLGVEPRPNLERAVQGYDSARAGFDPAGPDFARCLANEGNARHSLAKLGVEPRPNLERAVQRYEAARAGFDPAGPDFASCLMNEGTARQSLAELGVESRQNLERAVQRYEAARAGFDPAGPDFARCLANEGTARCRLADLGVEPRPNLERAVQRYEAARAGFDPAGPDFARCLMNEGTARCRLADLGVEPRPNLQQAVQRYEAARAGFDPAGPDFARCLMNEGNARQSLAELGVEPRPNLERAVQRYEAARAGFDPAGPDFARCLMNEGNARQSLAALGVEPRPNLGRAVQRYEAARAGFDPAGPDFARCLMNEGNARQSLAALGVEPRPNLERAVQRYEAARAGFDPAGPDFARCLMNEGNARQNLAALGVEPDQNGAKGSQLHGQAGERFLKLGHHADAVKAFSNQGLHLRTGALAADQGERNEEALAAWRGCREAYVRAIGALETVRAQMAAQGDRRDWFDRNLWPFLRAVEASLELNEVERALEFAVQGRGRTLTDVLSLRENRPRGVADADWQRYQDLVARLDVIDRPAGSTVGSALEAADAQSPARLDPLAARAELAALEAQFCAADPEYDPASRPLNHGRITGIAHDLGRTLVIPWIGDRRACAFLVHPDRRIVSVDLPGLNEAVLEEWMIGAGGWLRCYVEQHNAWATYKAARDDLRSAPTYPKSQAVMAARQRYEEARQAWAKAMTETLAAVHRLIIAPVDAALGDGDRPRRVAVVTGGYLGMLPLHAAGDSTQCWADRVELIHGPSIAVLARCQERSKPPWSPVLGGIDPLATQPLPFSRWEWKQLAAAVQKAGGRHTDLVGANATLDAVRGPLANHGITHFSCHGGWNADDPLRSAVELADGPLTLGELLRERQCHARLVTLSACETALGLEAGRRGDDYLGLPAGFLLAGARAVVGSFWSVLDPITALFMNELYPCLLQGKPLPAAVRSAQLALRQLPKTEAIERLRAAADDLAWRESFERQHGGAPFETWLDEFQKYMNEFDESATLSHPYFWAGFAAYGSADAVVEPAGDDLSHSERS